MGKKCKKGGGCKGPSRKGGGCEGGSGRSDGNCEGPGCDTSGSKDKDKDPPCNTPNCIPGPPPPPPLYPGCLLLVPHHLAERIMRKEEEAAPTPSAEFAGSSSSPSSIGLHAVAVKSGRASSGLGVSSRVKTVLW